MTEPAPIKPYNTKQLAALYGIGKVTMRVWLNKIREKILDPQLGRSWNIRQVKIIFEHFGHPEIQQKNKTLTPNP